jgi:hypothetical protein
MSNTAASRYTQLEAPRRPFLDRARDAALLTIPGLMPPEGHTGFTKLSTPYQGIGARGVNNLAAKLLLALLPPNSPFFRLQVDDFTLIKMTKQEGMRAEVEKALGMIERSVMGQIEAGAMRVTAFEAIKHLINDGNALCYLPEGGGMKLFRLDRFCIERDPMGNVLEIITKEDMAHSAMPPHVRQLIPAGAESKDPNAKCALYTHVQRSEDGKFWKVYQEVHDAIIPGSYGTYPIGKSPWIPLRWSKIDGESYGRGYVEEYIGDLKSLEALSQAIVEGSAAAAKVLFLVNPNGSTNMKVVQDAPNLAVRAGKADDVTVLHMEKFNDFKVAQGVMESIEKRVSMAFLLNSSVQRSGERVTAEEIRYVASELEDGLGGVYSILSQEFQLPFVTRIMWQMERQKKLPALPKGMVRPVITTGLEALGRGHDLTKLDTLLQRLQPLGPEVIATYLKVGDYISRVGTSLGIDMAGLVATDQEVQAAQQAAQARQMMDKLGPKGMDIVRDQMKPQAPNGPQG